jgi:hypothetical protein
MGTVGVGGIYTGIRGSAGMNVLRSISYMQGGWLEVDKEAISAPERKENAEPVPNTVI